MKILFCLTFAFWAAIVNCQSSEKFYIHTKNYTSDSLLIGYYLGDKTYISDTLLREPKGRFVVRRNKPHPAGIYLLVFKPKNDYVEFILNPDDRDFSIIFDYNNLHESLSFTGSIDNMIFHDYTQFLKRKSKEITELSLDKEELSNEEKQKKEQINQQVLNRQFSIINQYPNTITSQIIKANLPFEFPEFKGTKEQVEYQKWQYYKKHYFDYINLDHPSLLRTPFLFDKVNYYVHQLTMKHPDSITKSIDTVLEKMKNNYEMRKFYTINFLNTFASSNIHHMDKVYVHMVDNYYANGKADWVKPQQLNKIIASAEKLKPLLKGKKIPSLTLERKNKSKLSIYDLKSKGKLLYFWDPTCKECSNGLQKIMDNQKVLNDKGVNTILICTVEPSKASACWQNKWAQIESTIITENVDLVKKKFNLSTLPNTFLIDQNNRIVYKKMNLDNLNDYLNSID